MFLFSFFLVSRFLIAVFLIAARGGVISGSIPQIKGTISLVKGCADQDKMRVGGGRLAGGPNAFNKLGTG